MDWEQIRKLFLSYLKEYLNELGDNADEFFEKLVERLREDGLKITPEAEGLLQEYFQKQVVSIFKEIQKVIALGKAFKMSDEQIKKAYEEVINYRYPDRLNLSERLWKWQTTARVELKNTLAKLVRQAESHQKVMYELQFALERVYDREYVNTILENLPKYLQEVEASARMYDPVSIQKAIRKAERQIKKLKLTHNIANARQLIKELQEGLAKQSQSTIENAVRWWLYNRQLYRLQTIARTELSTAFHVAQITATEEDEDIIGYRWTLSPSHPRPDICDVYATVDFGLGEGVWPKDKILRRKAHPHCMCYLVPVLKRRGMQEKETQIDREVLKTFAPKWVLARVEAGEDILNFFDFQSGRFKRQWEVGEL